MDAQHRAVHRLGAVVEEVPGARDAVAVGDGHRARPRRVEPGQAGQVRRARRARCSGCVADRSGGAVGGLALTT